MIRMSDEAVAVSVTVVQSRSFKFTPALNHPGQIRCALRIKGRIKMNRKPEGSWRRCKMRLWCDEGHAFRQSLTQWNVVPSAYFLWIEMVNAAQAEQFVQAGNHTAVFQVCQSADMNDELRPAVSLREFITGLFNVSVRKR